MSCTHRHGHGIRPFPTRDGNIRILDTPESSQSDLETSMTKLSWFEANLNDLGIYAMQFGHPHPRLAISVCSPHTWN